MIFIDVRRAHFTAKATREMAVQLPPELDDGTHVAELVYTMYGCRDAAFNWENEYSPYLEEIGFVRGGNFPAVYYHPLKLLELSVHGDDFSALGEEDDLRWLEAKMREKYELKVRGLLGFDPSDDKSIRVLNRIISIVGDGVEWEADPRHAQLIVEQLGLTKAKAVATPGSNDKAAEDATLLDVSEAKLFRSVCMRAQFLAQDYPVIQFAAKECGRFMKDPTVGAMVKLKRLGRFLIGSPRCVWRFVRQKPVKTFDMMVDTDDAGCLRTRKSTSSGYLFHGRHLIRAYSSTQSVVAQSSGESEFYGAIKGVSSLIGARSMAEEFGSSKELHLHTDASACKSMLSRRGLGKTKHIARCYMWAQQRCKKVNTRGDYDVHKVGTKVNCADLGTKNLDRQSISRLISLAGLELRQDTHQLALKV